MERLEERYMLSGNPLTTLDTVPVLTADSTFREEYLGTPPETAAWTTADGDLVLTSPVFDSNLAANQGSGSLMPVAPFPLEQTFFLHSVPGATKTIYLDFDGFLTRQTNWNSAFALPNIVTPALSLDGDFATFSPAELQMIQEVWELVAEDFRPFDVNVTTQDPGEEALRNTGGTDEQWGIRVAIGGSSLDWYTPVTGNPVGGVAFLTSFTWDTDTPTFVFQAETGGTSKGIAEATSHEVGHTLGLAHDGQYRFYRDVSNPDNPPVWVRVRIEYYEGHVNPPTGAATDWAPIMGVGYYVPLTQWGKGEYPNATNIEDDLAIITANNGFGYRTDDHGSSRANASALVTDDTIFSAEGNIEQNTDQDFFSFTVEGIGESITLDIAPFHRGPNLDILARLYNSFGVEIARSNPEFGLEAGSGTYNVSTDGGWFMTLTGQYLENLFLTAGTYYVSVEGASRPIAFIDPTIHPGPVDLTGPPFVLPPDTSDWGYSNYGSLGYYSIVGIRKALVVGIDFDMAGGTGPLDWNLFSGGGSQNLLSNLISEAGVATPYDLLISTTGTTIEGFPSESPINSTDIPNHTLPLDALDGYLATGGETLSFVWHDLEPFAVYQVWVFGHADMEARNIVEIVGGEWNGAAQTFNFTQTISQNALVVNDNHTPGNLDLSTLPYLVVANELGEIAINVTNEFGYALAIAGLAIAPTKLGSIEGEKWNDRNGNRIQGGGEEGLAGWTIYLDLNNNGQLDLISTPEHPVTVDAPNVPQPITDHSTVKNELLFEQPGQIIDVDVTLDISHTYDGDLDVYLTSPTGTRVKLFDDVGGFGDNFTNTTLDDEAAISITAGAAPFTGRFRPEEFLSAFDGESANGIWELEITDDALNDTGVLNSWSITITLSGFDVFLEPFIVTDFGGNYSFADLRPGVYYVREHMQQQQTLDGWRQTWAPPPVTVTSGARVRNIDFGNWIPTSQRGSIQGQKFNDVNGDGVKDAGENGLEGWIIYLDSNGNGVRDTATAPTTVASTDVPLPITDFSSVPSQVTFDGVGTILKVEVTLDITHSFVGDLDAFLISPSGRTVELFTGVGGQFNDFRNLTLDDAAARSIATIGFDDLPYTGRWQPEGLLSDFNGEDAIGVWTLLIRDNAFADEGVLNSWSLTITVGEVFTQTDADGGYLFDNLPEGQYIVREEQQPNWAQVPPATTTIIGAVWENSQWLVTIVALDDPNDPNGSDSRRNVKNVDFGNRTGAPVLPGDYNQNGIVDAADYVLWRKALATSVSPPFSGADGNGNGAVDQADYGVWTANFGNTNPPGGGAAIASESSPTSATSAPAAADSSTQLVMAAGSDTKSDETNSGKPSTNVESATPAPVFMSERATLDISSRDDLIERSGINGNQASDAALVAWLASLNKIEKAAGEDDSIDADSAQWSEDSFDSLEPIDSVFELLGAAVA